MDSSILVGPRCERVSYILALPLGVRRGHVRALSGLHHDGLGGRSSARVRNSHPREPEDDDTCQTLWLAGLPPLPRECAPWLDIVHHQGACPCLGQPPPTRDVHRRQEDYPASRASDEPGLDCRWGQPSEIPCHAAPVRLVNRLPSKSDRSPPYHLGLNLSCIVQRFLHGGAAPRRGASTGGAEESSRHRSPPPSPSVPTQSSSSKVGESSGDEKYRKLLKHYHKVRAALCASRLHADMLRSDLVAMRATLVMAL